MGNEKEPKPPEHGLLTVQDALAYGGRLYDSAADFDAAFDHIVAQLHDASVLFDRGSYPTAAFLAITAMEETAKAHVAVYRRDRSGEPAKGRDPLHDHRSKHRMAILPTVFMSDRLVSALGAETCERLETEAQTSGFIATREASLYCTRINERFVTPRKVITLVRARELLLLAIEAADDALVGYTNHSLDPSSPLEVLFDKIARVATP